jgi:hypothetical protein
MIFELSIDTAIPGHAARIVDLVRDVRLPHSGKRGAVQGVWTSEFGPVNQVVQMWAYENLAGWSAAQDALAADEGFQAQYVQPLRTHATEQERRLLRAQKPFRLDIEPGHFYELRMYSLVPGGIPRFVQPMLDILPLREKYSINMGVWAPLTGDINQLVHMWAYRDLAHRTAVRGGIAKEPEWKAYLDVIFPLITRMQCTILMPAPFSPVR